jgi:MinD superfamily P-loop ATPase
MKEVVVLSGKGGTGKTSIVGSFAALAERKVLVDCDVDAADLCLILNSTVQQTNEFWSGQTALIDEDMCKKCGLCAGYCRFNAIKGFRVDPVSCEGCGFCSRLCPVEAIKMKEDLSGHWFISDTTFGKLVHARLGIAQENSGKLVTTVRQQARKIAEEQGADFIISDGPPGIGCPVISSLSGADLALLITEPTLSGQHDLERVIGVCQHFDIRALVCVNKYDINEDNTRQIKDYCRHQNLDIAGEIPYDNTITEAIIKGKTVVEYSHNGAAQQIKKIWEKIHNYLAG